MIKRILVAISVALSAVVFAATPAHADAYGCPNAAVLCLWDGYYASGNRLQKYTTDMRGGVRLLGGWNNTISSALNKTGSAVYLFDHQDCRVTHGNGLYIVIMPGQYILDLGTVRPNLDNAVGSYASSANWDGGC
jgi:hypothetical protein